MNPARAYGELDRFAVLANGDSIIHRQDCRVKIILTSLFLLLLVSVGKTDLPTLGVMTIFPLWATLLSGAPFAFLIKRALLTLPFTVMIGLFNPWFDRETVLVIGSYGISAGWLSLVAIILRGVLAAWCAMLLVATTGFPAICTGLRYLGVPSLLTTQLLLVFRYIFVLLDEVSGMLMARSLRLHGRRAFTLRGWGAFTGTLLARSLDRASRLNAALVSRGFDGCLPVTPLAKLNWNDFGFAATATALLMLLRYGDLARLAGHWAMRLI